MYAQRVAKTCHVGQQKAANFPSRSKKRAQSKLNPLLQLHQTIGNRAVGRMIQSKLTIGQPGDKYEQEADRVAEKVVNMSEPRASEGGAVSNLSVNPAIQRVCSECEQEMRRQSQQSEDLGLSGPVEEEELQRQAGEEEEEETVAAKGISGHTPLVTPQLQSNINNLRGAGKPLPASVSGFFEPRFRQDFSGVRIHTDARAAKTAQAVNAKAFTVGRDIVFGSGQYSPETTVGQRLLAHELTHVVQQRTNKIDNLQKDDDDMTFTILESDLAAAENRQESADHRQRREAAARFLNRSIQTINAAIAGRFLVRHLEIELNGRIYMGSRDDPAHPVTNERNVPGETWTKRNRRLSEMLAKWRELYDILIAQPIPEHWYPENAQDAGTFSSSNPEWVDLSYFYTRYIEQPDGSQANTYFTDVLYFGHYELDRSRRGRQRGIPTGINIVVPDPDRDPYNYQRLDSFSSQRGMILEVWSDQNVYFYYWKGQEIYLPGRP